MNCLHNGLRDEAAAQSNRELRDGPAFCESMAQSPLALGAGKINQIKNHCATQFRLPDNTCNGAAMNGALRFSFSFSFSSLLLSLKTADNYFKLGYLCNGRGGLLFRLAGNFSSLINRFLPLLPSTSPNLSDECHELKGVEESKEFAHRNNNYTYGY